MGKSFSYILKYNQIRRWTPETFSLCVLEWWIDRKLSTNFAGFESLCRFWERVTITRFSIELLPPPSSVLETFEKKEHSFDNSTRHWQRCWRRDKGEGREGGMMTAVGSRIKGHSMWISIVERSSSKEYSGQIFAQPITLDHLSIHHHHWLLLFQLAQIFNKLFLHWFNYSKVNSFNFYKERNWFHFL